ncbi:MAG: type II secretion system protein GspG [Planctomycetes bacterium]|nr:type II secretion system protein GspG [Planctomycetota bacterium]MBL7044273.1 type II secretion system protein GspG [Pirellulaceae bacterium]
MTRLFKCRRHKSATAVIAYSALAMTFASTIRAGEETADVSLQAKDGTDLIRCEEITRYDWQTHTLTLQRKVRGKLYERLRSELVRGHGFQFVVNGKPIYSGTITTAFSSFSFGTPVIVLDEQITGKKLDENQIRIDLGYPSEKFFKGRDPRGDERIKDALKELGKLEAKDGVAPKKSSAISRLMLKRKIAITNVALMALRSALESYRLDMFDFPDEKDGLEALVKAPKQNARHWRGPYFDPSIPKDPWGNAFVYGKDAEKGVLLSSKGPDGKADTEDDIILQRD